MTQGTLGWLNRNRSSLLTIFAAVLGALTTALPSAYFANQANQNASSAAEDAKNADLLASSAFSIANNYPPSIEVESTSLELRPADCSEYSGNVSCIFTGTFNVSFTIIGPHVGAYNITFHALNSWGSFFPGPAAFTNNNPPSVRIGNITIVAYPPLEYQWNGAWTLPNGGVPVSSSQPFVKTEEISAYGFKLVAPSSSMKTLNFQGQATLSYLLTFSDQQQPGREFQHPFDVHVDFLF